MKTILWPTDLSSTSLKAAPRLLDLLKIYDARLVVLYVAVDLCDYFPAYGDYPSQDRVRDFQSWELEHAKKRLEEFCAREFTECPGDLKLRLVQGNAAERILKTAKEEDADMIVLTTRGHGADRLSKASGLGSVAERVVSSSPVNVMLLAPGE
jgi:nucleotide-binding universal stress UspA family protein